MKFQNAALAKLNFDNLVKEINNDGNLIAVIENLREEAHSGTEQGIQSTEIVLSTEEKKDLSLLRDTDLAAYLVVLAKKNLTAESANTPGYKKKKLASFIQFCRVLCTSSLWKCLALFIDGDEVGRVPTTADDISQLRMFRLVGGLHTE